MEQHPVGRADVHHDGHRLRAGHFHHGQAQMQRGLFREGGKDQRGEFGFQRLKVHGSGSVCGDASG